MSVDHHILKKKSTIINIFSDLQAYVEMEKAYYELE